MPLLTTWWIWKSKFWQTGNGAANRTVMKWLNTSISQDVTKQQKQESEVLFKNYLYKQAAITSPAIFTLLTRNTSLILFEVFLTRAILLQGWCAAE